MIELKNISKISINYDCFFIDLWGVIHNGVEIFEGVNQEMMDFVMNTRAGRCDINIDMGLLDVSDREISNFSQDYFDFKGFSLKEIANKLNAGSHLILNVPVI